ncbi:MAG TPA: PfkB family carbohydrate kinase [Thermoleophilaceae bacterium]|nr:PfkB family carbohydrate kinase [Thermoleophilaceae bacterium]
MSSRAGAALVVLGDALLDRDLEGTVERLSPEAPVPIVDDPVERTRPGGAALAAALAAADGERPVRLVTALADDEPAQELRDLVRRAGVELIEMTFDGPTPEKVRVRGGGRTLLRLDRGGRERGGVRASAPQLAAARDAISEAAAVLVSDYGRGVAALPQLRDPMAHVPAPVPLVWDPHPTGPEPVAGALLVTPNAAETARLAASGSEDGSDVARYAAELARRWRAAYVCVTRGGEGALLTGPEGPPLVVPAPATAAAGDPCGAGDRFASRAAMALAGGELPSAAVAGAVEAASAFVAAGGAGTALGGSLGSAAEAGDGSPRECVGEAAALALADRVRARGGTVVATGGCFDLLHAGHVSVLRAARTLGDCLIVLLNSDASMRRLKGADRPLVGQADRAAVLAALDSVDVVVVFDEDTPAAALERLRPDVFAKGGDYAGRDLLETPVIERHGGRAVVLPYVAGRSTARLIEEVALRAAR